jgi:probable HAF family extracellular repeat protein
VTQSTAAVFCALFGPLLLGGSVAAQSFTILLPSGATVSGVTDLSGDGQTAVGGALIGGVGRPVSWHGGAASVLPMLPGGTYSGAEGVSYDGATIVGWGSTSTSSSLGWRYRAGVMMSIGDLPGGPQASQALAVSGDGNVITGNGSSALGTEAIRWTEQGGMTALGDLAGGPVYSEGLAASADGSIIAGYGTIASNVRQAVRWTGNQMQQLPPLIAGVDCYATAMTPDGAIIVGTSSTSSGNQAVVWQNGTVTSLGTFGGYRTIAMAVSADGSVIVGRSAQGAGDIALLYDASGWHSIADLLQNQYGLNLGGLALREAWAISADGRTFAGWGDDAQGNARGWIATIPAPGTLVVVAALGCLGFRRRR